MDQKTIDEGKTLAIVSYITLIGLILAFILNNDKKNEFTKFHIRQALMLFLCGLVLGWIPLLGLVVGLAIFIFWIMGLICAIQGQAKEVPLIGKFAQDWFKGI